MLGGHIAKNVEHQVPGWEEVVVCPTKIITKTQMIGLAQVVNSIVTLQDPVV